MTTALDIITGALEEIGYKPAETPIESEDAELALTKLNDMLAEWSESGLLIGADPVEKTSDPVRISRGLVNGVKMNLAGRLSVPFKTPITQQLAESINAANKAMLRILVKIDDVEYPSSLPIGSGNKAYDDDEGRFFPENSEANF